MRKNSPPVSLRSLESSVLQEEHAELPGFALDNALLFQNSLGHGFPCALHLSLTGYGDRPFLFQIFSIFYSKLFCSEEGERGNKKVYYI